ncbi:glycerol-3-phosphate responsive antiterminator [Pseudalkalibacillus sp. A8]|uniref:glycerol-3-phosphate responsive antiterminator n=1 Tax=Pseudalkalibacillus sp. A8 TaxID=3382641 RepID=UPI0038B51B88
MNQTLFNNVIIPSVRDLKFLNKALHSPSPYMLLSDTHIGNLKMLTKECHKEGKKVLVHLDLVGGLNKDNMGLKLLKDLFKVDGIISPNAKLINRSKELGLIAVHRLFLLDSRSLESGLKAIKESDLNAVEVLPGPFSKAFLPQIKQVTDAPILAGGFISTKDDVIELFNAGIQGLTCSNPALWTTK